MSANDVLSLDAHFSEWSAARAASLKGVEPWEYYCVDQFLKRYPISDEDILAGITGGANDGGVDAIYFFVNRKIVDDETEIEPDTTLRINLALFQIKENAGFSFIEVDKLYFFTDDLLNLTIPATQFKSKYHTRLIEIMDTFKTRYPRLVGAFPQVNIDYFYISKIDGPGANVHPPTQQASDRVLAKAKEHLSSAQCTFHFIDAPQLWTQVQLRPPKTRTLKWTDARMETPEGYVGLVRLADYFSFLQDDDGNLSERIFDSNVRGFQQNTPVNVSIRNTLKTPPEADFWLLNNGITILASKLDTAGFKSLAIEDPQVVNGLQTSRELFAYYKANGSAESDNRRLLIRVIKPSSSAVREDIVRATNSQNKMPPAALRATDPIHGHIETIFRQHGLYYDRRPGQHKDAGKPIDKIISIVGLLQTVVAIVLGKPHEAYGAPGRYIRIDDQYDSVFGDGRHPLPIYLNCIKIQRAVDSFLQAEKLGLERGHRPRIRFYLATYVTCAHAEKAEPSQSEILSIDADKLSDAIIDDCYKRVWKKYQKAGGDNIAAKSRKIFDSLQREIRKRFPTQKANS